MQVDSLFVGEVHAEKVPYERPAHHFEYDLRNHQTHSDGYKLALMLRDVEWLRREMLIGEDFADELQHVFRVQRSTYRNPMYFLGRHGLSQVASDLRWETLPDMFRGDREMQLQGVQFLRNRIRQAANLLRQRHRDLSEQYDTVRAYQNLQQLAAQFDANPSAAPYQVFWMVHGQHVHQLRHHDEFRRLYRTLRVRAPLPPGVVPQFQPGFDEHYGTQIHREVLKFKEIAQPQWMMQHDLGLHNL